MKKTLFRKLVAGVATLSMVFTMSIAPASAALTDTVSKLSGTVDSLKDAKDKVVDTIGGAASSIVGVGQVTGLEVLEADEDEVTLYWTKVTLAKSYGILMYSSSNETWDEVATTTENSYEIENLASASIYKFKVVAYDSKGKKGEESAVIQTVTKPQEVDNLTAKKAKTSITLSWDKVKRATKYQVYKFNNKTGTWSRVATTEKSSYKVTDLKAGTTYKFKVRAYRKALDDIYYGDFETITAKTTGASSSSSSYIGEDKALSIALSKAGVSKSNAKFVMVNMDSDDGVKIYEVEFEGGEFEYEFEINAKTGRIIEWEKEYI